MQMSHSYERVELHDACSAEIPVFPTERGVGRICVVTTMSGPLHWMNGYQDDPAHSDRQTEIGFTAVNNCR